MALILDLRDAIRESVRDGAPLRWKVYPSDSRPPATRSSRQRQWEYAVRIRRPYLRSAIAWDARGSWFLRGGNPASACSIGCDAIDERRGRLAKSTATPGWRRLTRRARPPSFGVLRATSGLICRSTIRT